MREWKKCDTERWNWSLVDIFMILYGLLTFVSYCFSDYKEMALFGYADRYMGLVTWLALVGGYFLVSHFFAGQRLWEALGRTIESVGFSAKAIFRGILSIVIMTGLVILLYQMVEPMRQLFEGWQVWSLDGEWTEKSNALREAVGEWFQRSSWQRKMLGEGPDCFECVIYKEIDLSGQMISGARSEWTGLLVNGGLLGVSAYIGILGGSIFEILRSRGRHPVYVLGAVVIFAYIVMGSFRSGQPAAWAFLFGILGILQGISRRGRILEEAVRRNRAAEAEVAGMERALFFLQDLQERQAAEGGKEAGSIEDKKVKSTGQKGKRMQRLACVTTGLMAGAILCLGYSVYLLVDLFGAELRSEAKMAALREQGEVVYGEVGAVFSEVGASEETRADEVSAEEHTTEEQTVEKETLEYDDYAPIFAQNQDMAAWLQIEGTKIDYPVMQTPRDENYYLYRDFYGEADRAGCLILDTDSDLKGEGTTNLIIHGHNMKSGTMFGELDKYREKAYAEEHGRILLITKEEVREYEVFAVFYSQVYLTTDITFKFYNFFRADTEEQFQYFYENIKKLSLYDTGVEAVPGDDFLTLSTCSYHTEDGRFVVVAKEKERKK